MNQLHCILLHRTDNPTQTALKDKDVYYFTLNKAQTWEGFQLADDSTMPSRSQVCPSLWSANLSVGFILRPVERWSYSSSPYVQAPQCSGGEGIHTILWVSLRGKHYPEAHQQSPVRTEFVPMIILEPSRSRGVELSWPARLHHLDVEWMWEVGSKHNTMDQFR